MCSVFQEKEILSEKHLYIWYYSLTVLLTFPFWKEMKKKDAFQLAHLDKPT